MADKAQLIITALQQRIGEIVSNYETQIAILRAEITNAYGTERDAKVEAVKEYEEHLNNIVNRLTSLLVSLLKQIKIHIGLKMVKDIGLISDRAAKSWCVYNRKWQLRRL
jgi:hypothetical protein